MARKLIEVSLPLEAINAAAAREDGVSRGNPKPLHLWWARRPLAAARTVIFASLITDPSDPDYPWRDGEDRGVERERDRLHDLIRRMLRSEISESERIMADVHAEILRHTNGTPPSLLDPFAGGGIIPLEAQRLGLEAHASDLNPVAVLINKAMIEIPPTFAGMPPVNPEHQGSTSRSVPWRGAAGLAEDVRYYGKWMLGEAERQIGHLYPKVTLPKEQGGGEATVIAWLWARTVTCPNPACGATMPLVRSFVVSKKKGSEAYIQPVVREDRSGVEFVVHQGKCDDSGTVDRKGARCLVCDSAVPFIYLRSEGKAGRIGQQLMAIVAEGRRSRSYLNASELHQEIVSDVSATWRPDQTISHWPGRTNVVEYGMTTFGDLFTERQLLALTTFSDLVGEARERVAADALAAGRPSDPMRLADGGTGEEAYADAVATYLAFVVDRLAMTANSIVRWNSTGQKAQHSFGRQSLPMVWDYAEPNIFADSTGSVSAAIELTADPISFFPCRLEGSIRGTALQQDAATLPIRSASLVSTDPPYYDNVGYAGLSDFFYVWLRRSICELWPSLLTSRHVPKDEELVATPYRFEGGKKEAEDFFEAGLFKTFDRLSRIEHTDYPLTVFYAFKQAESENKTSQGQSISSTGWETMLEGLVGCGLQVTATWPMRTEKRTRMIAAGTNALASSIVLACRVRPEGAPEATRQQFVRELRQKLADDLRPLQQASIAPVDLAQAAIGPGMAIYSKYSRVREASGDALRVRGALALINQALDEVLSEQDEEYDNATRWAISWYESFSMNEGPFGDAEGFARARNVAVDDLAHDGVVKSGRGKVRFVWREELPVLDEHWHPRSGDDVSDWLVMQHLAHAIQQGQEAAAEVKATIDRALPGRTSTAHDLAYRVFNIAERKGWNREALAYNTLIQNWAEIDRLAVDMAAPATTQQLRLGE